MLADRPAFNSSSVISLMLINSSRREWLVTLRAYHEHPAPGNPERQCESVGKRCSIVALTALR